MKKWKPWLEDLSHYDEFTVNKKWWDKKDKEKINKIANERSSLIYDRKTNLRDSRVLGIVSIIMTLCSFYIIYMRCGNNNDVGTAIAIIVVCGFMLGAFALVMSIQVSDNEKKISKLYQKEIDIINKYYMEEKHKEHLDKVYSKKNKS
jgi:hypothetical protein